MRRTASGAGSCWYAGALALVLTGCARDHHGGRDDEAELDSAVLTPPQDKPVPGIARDASADDARNTQDAGRRRLTDAGFSLRDATVIGNWIEASVPNADAAIPPDPMIPGDLAKRCALPLRLAAEDVYKAAQADDVCSSHSDCQVRNARVSCTDHCPRAALSARGVMELSQRLAQIERERCQAFLADPGCGPLNVTPNCYDAVPAVARCDEGHCMVHQPGCGKGCSAEPIDGICRGATLCDGCPAVVHDFVGSACTQPDRVCAPSGFCPPTIRCRDDDGDGSYVWVEETLLCSVQSP